MKEKENKSEMMKGGKEEKGEKYSSKMIRGKMNKAAEKMLFSKQSK